VSPCKKAVVNLGAILAYELDASTKKRRSEEERNKPENVAS
jgi:hypothetical protein